jgi:hypothetical protein
MEPSGRNQWQPAAMLTPRKQLKQAKTVATGCDQLPLNLDGKEGVDGSSPSEGFDKNPANMPYSVAWSGEFETLRGYERGTFWDWWALAGTGDQARSTRGRAEALIGLAASSSPSSGTRSKTA